MRIKQYPNYKKTHIAWLGEIPEHWKTKRIKHTTYVKGRIGWKGLTSNEFIDEGPFLITGTDFYRGRINWNKCYHVSEERYQEDPFIIVKPGDLLITKDGTIGKLALIDSLPNNATLNSGVFVTRPKSNEYISEFLFWVLDSRVFLDFIDIHKAGTTISHLYQNVFMEFYLPIPPINEQKIISNYLFRKTSRIDSLIEKKLKQIDLLQEKRSALISHAVTKGIDSDFPLKDSGVEWLGKIPDHWGVVKIKYLTKKIGSGKTPRGGADVYVDSGVMLLRSQNIHNTGLKLDDVVFIEQEMDVSMSNTRVQNGDVLLNITGASLGRSCLFSNDSGPANVNQHVCIIRPSQKMVIPEFLSYSICSSAIQFQIFSNENGTSREGLNFDEVGNLLVVLPPTLQEQKTIISILHKKTALIDSVIEKVERSIEIMKEYRNALISSTVTGVIDVRGEVF